MKFERRLEADPLALRAMHRWYLSVASVTLCILTVFRNGLEPALWTQAGMVFRQQLPLLGVTSDPRQVRARACLPGPSDDARTARLLIRSSASPRVDLTQFDFEAWTNYDTS